MLSHFPIIKKEDCWFRGDPKVVIFNAFKLWKMQRPLRAKLKEQEMMKILKDMNS